MLIRHGCNTMRVLAAGEAGRINADTIRGNTITVVNPSLNAPP